MEFDQLLDDVTRLVSERGRVSLAALAQYFDLDATRLAAVRDELVHARGTLALENDRVLVAHAGIAGAEATPAERRHLTVMFVDMVGSTDLAARLDPEDLREVVRDYQITASGAIERYQGHIAQYLGDGLLVYFGYPVANEDDPRRAVYAAQQVLAQIDKLNGRIEPAFGVRIALRIGIHTGLVVIGALGDGQRQEALALGETPNFAARLESIAQPGTIVISEATRDLLDDLFEVVDLGPHELKGIPGARRIFSVVKSSGISSRFDQAVKHKLLPLVGRRSELNALTARWEQARHGNGSVVLIRGEAGIGKSRLIQALKDHLIGQDQRWTALRASPYENNTPLYPVIELFRQTIEIDPAAPAGANLARIEAVLADFGLTDPQARDLVAFMLGIDVQQESDGERFSLNAVVSLVEGLFLQLLKLGPRLLVVEDLHWLDPTSLSLVQRLCAGAGRRPLLAVFSARPQFDTTTLDYPTLVRIELGALPRADVEQMISSVAGGRTLAREVRQQIIRRTDGVPAFVEELTRMLLASEWLVDQDGHLSADGPAPAAIPETLKDTLMARLDQLGAAKMVAQEAAVLGRTFSAQLLAQVSSTPAPKLQQVLATLVEADILRRRDYRGTATYRFRHALLQEAAYQSILKSARQALHLRIATVLEGQFDEPAPPPPARVAHHFTQAREAARAVGYWQWAAEQAVEKAANREALSFLQNALDLLPQLPASRLRDQRELSLLSIMGSAMVQSGGWAAPGLGDIYHRAMALIGHAGAAEHVDFQVLGGLCAYHLVRGDFQIVDLLADRLLRQGQDQRDDASRVVAYVCLASAAFSRGDFSAAREHAARVTQFHDPITEVPVSFLYGQDPSVIADTLVALIELLEGNAPKAFAVSEQAMHAATRVKSPFSSMWARAWHARLLLESGQYAAAYELAHATGIECARRDFGYIGALTDSVAGVAQLSLTDGERGLGQVRAGFGTFLEHANALASTYFHGLAARGERLAGHSTQAAQLVAQGLAAGAADGENFWQSELLRLEAQLHAAHDAAAALARADAALTAAEALRAPLLTLRAAVTLAELARGVDEAQATRARAVLRAALAQVTAPHDEMVTTAQALLAEDSGPGGG